MLVLQGDGQLASNRPGKKTFVLYCLKGWLPALFFLMVGLQCHERDASSQVGKDQRSRRLYRRRVITKGRLRDFLIRFWKHTGRSLSFMGWSKARLVDHTTTIEHVIFRLYEDGHDRA